MESLSTQKNGNESAVSEFRGEAHSNGFNVSAPKTSVLPTAQGSKSNGEEFSNSALAQASKTTTPASLITTAGPYGILRLPIRGFASLAPRDRALCHYLGRAALAGRDITWDQRHHLALTLRRTLEDILTTNQQLTASFRSKLLATLRLLWIANGPYDTRTGRKLEMQFKETDWSEMLQKHAATTDKPVEVDPRLTSFMFKPNVDPYLVGPDGRDPLSSSSANFYLNVTLRDLREFKEMYPLNSRLEKQGERVIEHVYRTGRAATPGQRPAPKGMYSTELTHVVAELRRAIQLARPKQATQLRHLVEYFETGNPTAFDRFNTEWVQLRNPVDTIMGFIETDDDARGVKGTWEGVVLIPDTQVQALIDGLHERADYFEHIMPWKDEYKRETPEFPRHEAWQVVTAHGDAGPDIPLGMNLPNSDVLRTKYGHRSILFTNVIRATDEATESLLVDEFAPVDERAAARRCAGLNSDLTLILHEVVGHGAGQLAAALMDTSPDLHLKEYATAIEETRAELVALYLLWDPEVRALYPRYSDDCAEAALRSFVRRDLMMLRQVAGSRLEDNHKRATHLIVGYGQSREAIAPIKVRNQTFLVIRDIPAMKTAIRDLLIEIMRIRAEGDYAGARQLFTTYGLFFDKALRDEIVARAQSLSIPQHYAFLLPEVVPRELVGGIARDAVLRYVNDFDSQMLQKY